MRKLPFFFFVKGLCWVLMLREGMLLSGDVDGMGWDGMGGGGKIMGGSAIESFLVWEV